MAYNPFPTIKIVRGVTWRKVKDEEHRDSLNENMFKFKHFYDPEMRFGFSFHLYYTKKTFKLSKRDLEIIEELDQMLEYVLRLPIDRREIEISRQLGPTQQFAQQT